MRRVLLALMALFIIDSAVHAADKIRIGFPDFVSQFSTLPLAQKKGFLQEEGLQAELIRINATVGISPLANAEIDYYPGIGPGVAGVLQGVPIKVVACYVPSAPFALIARPEFQSVQELRGKAVALNTFGGNIEVVARLIFKHFGLDADKEVKFLALGTNERRFAAMKQGLAAATLGTPPMDFFGKKLGFVVLTRAHELFSYPASGVLVSVKKLRERPNEIKRVIKAGIRFNRYFRQSREGAIPAMMEWMKIDKEIATATYESVVKSFNDDGGLPEEGLRLLIDEAKKQTKVNRDVAPSDVADLSSLREAQKELRIRR
ncbi:MAG TPA: ABC transporter substrate-binding protein [Candidatus Saccharimonadales bacterium]|nr:ABC transporter substrate-binding protein [Candidatus Saccharimonadales bacterium]